jgi:hypothetical protein
MNEDIESVELKRFYQSLQEDIRTIALSSEEGAFQEQIFTQYALELLTDGGETESPRSTYDEKTSKAGVQHKINGHAVSDNYETVDLFISIYHGTDGAEKVSKEEVDRAAKRLFNFFKNAYYGNHHESIEESQEIYQFAESLARSKELRESLVRVNGMILTDGVYSGKAPSPMTISGYKIDFKVIDLNYLYNLTEKSHIPIEIDFANDGFSIPCIKAPFDSKENDSYLAIVPGSAIANIYERFGARLLEQNIRSFLQFTGKINKGIRGTILNEPEMFLAFNNGIAATAESIVLQPSEDGAGHILAKANDLQIVNGGQTTASIFYTWKKDKANLSKVFVQMKLTVVHNPDKFSEVVGRIAEYANTQNRVSIADLSSNRPFHIQLEKLSRSIWAPPSESAGHQTRWFYERARGQYKNARIKEGMTKAKQKAFDLSNPRSQIITKESLAKYINAFSEFNEKGKVVSGPHFVVRGGQKNYVQFIKENLPKSPDSVYFEDSIAKAILFNSAERIYGVKPKAIGDMRYITVPYTLSYLSFITEGKLDLYKIWKAQSISAPLNKLLFLMMTGIEAFIKKKAPGSLYGEWAKKEDCWTELKVHDFKFDLSSIKLDLLDPKTTQTRRKVSEADTEQLLIEAELDRVMAISNEGWKLIESWGNESGLLSQYQRNAAWHIGSKVRERSKFSDIERATALKILDIVAEERPDLFFTIEDEVQRIETKEIEPAETITMDLIGRMVAWEKKNKKLPLPQVQYLIGVANGKFVLDANAQKYLRKVLANLRRFGFR